jgi:hypothetical protein
MNISFGSYKLRVEILIAIVVVFWIMFGHLLCSCCRTNLFEGMESDIERMAREVKASIAAAKAKKGKFGR